MMIGVRFAVVRSLQRVLLLVPRIELRYLNVVHGGSILVRVTFIKLPVRLCRRSLLQGLAEIEFAWGLLLWGLSRRSDHDTESEMRMQMGQRSRDQAFKSVDFRKHISSTRYLQNSSDGHDSFTYQLFSCSLYKANSSFMLLRPGANELGIIAWYQGRSRAQELRKISTELATDAGRHDPFFQF